MESALPRWQDGLAPCQPNRGEVGGVKRGPPVCYQCWPDTASECWIIHEREGEVNLSVEPQRQEYIPAISCIKYKAQTQAGYRKRGAEPSSGQWRRARV